MQTRSQHVMTISSGTLANYCTQHNKMRRFLKLPFTIYTHISMCVGGGGGWIDERAGTSRYSGWSVQIQPDVSLFHYGVYFSLLFLFQMVCCFDSFVVSPRLPIGCPADCQQLDLSSFHCYLVGFPITQNFLTII